MSDGCDSGPEPEKRLYSSRLVSSPSSVDFDFDSDSDCDQPAGAAAAGLKSLEMRSGGR